MYGGGYSSGFDEDGDKSKRKNSWKYDDISKKMKTHEFVGHSSKLPSKSSYVDSYEREEKKNHFADFLSMNAYSRHKKLVHDYLAYYGGNMKDFQRSNENDKTDYDIIKENYKFVWDDDEEDDGNGDNTSKKASWGKKLAKKYYDKLFKEYCICDISKYKENKIAMRWRVAKEVNEGKGQFICGSRKCEVMNGLKTWEVNFGYVEDNEKKNALVKLRLCCDCSYKLNYHHKHKRVNRKKSKKKSKKKKNKKKRHKEREEKPSSSSSSSSESDDSSNQEDNAGKIKEHDEKTASLSTKKDTSKDEKDESVWKKPMKVEKEKTRDEEFDEYFQDLFM